MFLFCCYPHLLVISPTLRKKWLPDSYLGDYNLVNCWVLMGYIIKLIPVVPHKAVAEVSKIGNL
jgi:hypothetical protein